jgi:hypothetical protein
LIFLAAGCIEMKTVEHINAKNVLMLKPHNKGDNMKTIVKITTITAAFFLSSCSTIDGLVTKGSEINDEAVRAAEFALCHGASIGSIRRHYGSEERADVWRKLCAEDKSFTPAEVSE